MLIINNRLSIPYSTKAILWDMDGVLLDTLALDIVLCNELINKYIGENIKISKNFIRSIFAHPPPKFWKLIFEHIKSEFNIIIRDNIYNEILYEYNKCRNESIFEVNPGINDILTFCNKNNIKLAVVSNNPTEVVKRIIAQSGIINYFDIIVGNDFKNLKPKPSPDTYIYAAKLLKVNPEDCVVVEDSLIGVEAGWHAKCFTVGVATGGDSFECLKKTQWANIVYSSFGSRQ